MNPVDEDKTHLRSRMKHTLARLTGDHKKRSAIRACGTFKAAPIWREIRSLLVYLSFGNELDLDPVIQAALTEGKHVYAPRINRDLMTFHRFTRLTNLGDTGKYGIRQPSDADPVWNALSSPGPAVILIPGLAFSRNGCRLGRGKGFYDRFLQQIRLESSATGQHPPLCIGCGFGIQIQNTVPTHPHDQHLDALLSDSGFEMIQGDVPMPRYPLACPPP